MKKRMHSKLKSKKKLQHFYFSFLSRKDVEDFENDIMTSNSAHDKARIFSADGSFAGAWLHRVPRKHEQRMAKDQFRKALRLRLGIPFHQKDQQNASYYPKTILLLI